MKAGFNSPPWEAKIVPDVNPSDIETAFAVKAMKMAKTTKRRAERIENILVEGTWVGFNRKRLLLAPSCSDIYTRIQHNNNPCFTPHSAPVFVSTCAEIKDRWSGCFWQKLGKCTGREWHRSPIITTSARPPNTNT